MAKQYVRLTQTDALAKLLIKKRGITYRADRDRFYPERESS
jgi:hypothetical protein